MPKERQYGECPLCCEIYTSPSEAEIYFCPCLYQICAFCREGEENCPKCRRPYDPANKRIIKNPLFHCTPERVKEIRMINPRLAKITPVLEGRDEELREFGDILSVTNLKNSTVVLFVHEEQAADCVQTMNGVRINDVLYNAVFGSATFCNEFLHGRKCENRGCYNFHEWGPAMEVFDHGQEHAITEAENTGKKAMITKFSGIPPSNAKIVSKTELIKALPYELRDTVKQWAYDILEE